VTLPSPPPPQASPPQAGDPAALISDHLHLVPATIAWMLKRPAHAVPCLYAAALDAGDLESVGYSALMRAAATYDPARGATFSTFAIRLIRQRLGETLKRAAAIPLSPSLDAPTRAAEATDGQGKALGTLGEMVGDPRANTEDRALAPMVRHQETAALWALVWRTLPERQACILWWHYAEGLTFREIGQRLGGITRQAVSVSHGVALGTLRRGALAAGGAAG
jgi:RNA polymerase sigma factor (sigma-70 family)